jgi:hypothetical protein
VIHAIALELGTALAARGVPYRVVYGPERTGARLTDTRIVVERPRGVVDATIATHSRPLVPNRIFARTINMTARVVAASTVAGAGVHDHERLADLLADQVEVALRTIVKGRNTIHQPGGWRFVPAAELELLGLDAWPGVVYEGSFAIDRGVRGVDWAGEGPDTATLVDGQIASETLVDYDTITGTPESACGGS